MNESEVVRSGNGRSPSRSRSPAPRSPVRNASRSKSRSRSPSRGRDRDRRRSPPRRRYKTPPTAEPCRVLGVFGLSTSTTERDLKDEFSKFGELDKIDLIIDKRTGNSRGFGFIYFSTVEEAIKAKEAMNGSTLGGRGIRTDFSTTKRAHSPTPGKYMGRETERDHRRPPPRRYDDRYSPDRRRRSPRRYSPYYDRERRNYRDDRGRDRDRYYDDRY